MSETSAAKAQEIFRDEFAPWLHDLNLKVEEIGPDGATLRMPFSEHLCRGGGTICGQSMMSLADTAMVFGVMGAAGYKPMTTVSQACNLMRPIADKDVIAKARVIRLGRMLAFGEVMLYADGDEIPAVHATTTFAFLPEKK